MVLEKIGYKNGTYFDQIPGATYMTVADSTYVIVPSGRYRVELFGFATSTYSVTVHTLKGDDMEESGAVFNASTTPDMEAVFAILDNSIQNMSVDLDADGTFDYEADFSTGLILANEPTSVIEKSGRRTHSGRGLQRGQVPKVAGAAVSQEELLIQYLQEMVRLLEDYIKLVNKKTP
jgi:hypothetical protein